MYKVLIIDDEKWSREVVKSLGNWQDLGLTIAGEAEDGTRGLEMIGELKPHIVITDMRMPGIDGAAFLKTTGERFPRLKIIVISGYDDFVYMKQAIRSGAVEYLLKPLNPAELQEALGKCVAQLKEQDHGAASDWVVPHIFTDPEVLDEYLDNRHRVFGFLLELDRQAVTRTLQGLQEFLDRVFPGTDDRNVLDKISHDYILMLEEFLSRNEIGFKQLLGEEEEEAPLMVRCGSVPEMITEIDRVYGMAVETIQDLRTHRTRFDVKEVQAHIDHYFQDPISLNTMAQHFYVSREHLSRTFKALTGENITDYITRRRMEKARELILQRHLSIKNVAQMTGYSDLAYFYKVFKKFYGVPPGEMKE